MTKIKSNMAISESSFTGGNLPHFKHRKPKSTIKYISEFKEEVRGDGFVTREMKPKSVVAHKKKNNTNWTHSIGNESGSTRSIPSVSGNHPIKNMLEIQQENSSQGDMSDSEQSQHMFNKEHYQANRNVKFHQTSTGYHTNEAGNTP